MNRSGGNPSPAGAGELARRASAGRRGHGPRTQSPSAALPQGPLRLRRLPQRRPSPALDPAPAPDHFSVAARSFWADDRKNDERLSSQTRHVVAGHCGILAPLPGIDCRPPKPKTKCVNHSSKMLVSQLSWTHTDCDDSEFEKFAAIYKNQNGDTMPITVDNPTGKQVQFNP